MLQEETIVSGTQEVKELLYAGRTTTSHGRPDCGR
jgi:hypothetical protein